MVDYKSIKPGMPLYILYRDAGQIKEITHAVIEEVFPDGINIIYKRGIRESRAHVARQNIERYWGGYFTDLAAAEFALRKVLFQQTGIRREVAVNVKQDHDGRFMLANMYAAGGSFTQTDIKSLGLTPKKLQETVERIGGRMEKWYDIKRYYYKYTFETKEQADEAVEACTAGFLMKQFITQKKR